MRRSKISNARIAQQEAMVVEIVGCTNCNASFDARKLIGPVLKCPSCREILCPACYGALRPQDITKKNTTCPHQICGAILRIKRRSPAKANGGHVKSIDILSVPIVSAELRVANSLAEQ